jgi:hypothetical protein
MGMTKISPFPGMIVLVNTKTGERTILEYLPDSYLERFPHAFTES